VAHVNVPLIGEVHLPSAFLFDIGVFLLVVGATSMVLIAIAHQTLRGHRIEREQREDREEAAQRAASARGEGGVPGDVAAP
jgi:multicomponent K+:H+ antiporter subunit A